MQKRHRNKLTALIKQPMYVLAGFFLVLVILFVSASLFRFRDTVYEREYRLQMNTLEDLSSQGSAILKERLNGYLNSMYSISEFFEKEDLKSEEVRQTLKAVADSTGSHFARMGVADAEGDAYLTNGKEGNISHTDYFQQAMSNKGVISESYDSDRADEAVFVVAVPVVGEADQAKGILMGVVETEEFRIFENTRLDDMDHYTKVIDHNGDYIVNTAESPMKVQSDNIYNVLDRTECSQSTADVKEQLDGEQKVLVEVNDGYADYLLYFTPLQINEWYVVTVMSRQGIMDRADFLLGSDVYWLMVKVGLAFALLFMGIVWYLWRDKSHVEKAYRQLRINDRMIRTAFSGTNTVILIYNAERDQLKIINNRTSRLELPEVVEHASKNLRACLPDHHKTRLQLADMFRELPKIQGEKDFELSLEIEGEMRSYILHVKTVEEENHRIVRHVGIIEDVTEKLYLQRETKLQQGLFSNMKGFLVVDLHEDRVLRRSEQLKNLYQEDDPYSVLFEHIMKAHVAETYQTYVAETCAPDRLFRAYREGKRDLQAEFPCIDKTGQIFWMESHIRMETEKETDHCLAFIVLQDISKKKNAEQRLREEADRDYLTGICNRKGATEKINRILREPAVPGTVMAFVILDLDQFKGLNDTLGHKMGDKALIDVAHIMKHHFREKDVICRLAGDEFVAFLRDIPADAIEKNVEVLLRKLKLTYSENGTEVRITASAGVAVAPADGTVFASLYRKADQALYQAKEKGKNTWCVYQEGQKSEV